MQNATPAARPNDDNDVICFEKPQWMSDEKWSEIVAATLDHIHATIVALRAENGQ